jgi:hypothetical protein
MKGSGWMGTSIRVGILFSLSGTMEISDRGQSQAALLANGEVIQNGLVYWYYINLKKLNVLS